MSDVQRGDRARPPGRLLSAGELSARRSAWRRRRRRRRAGLAIAVAVGLVVLAFALTGAGSRRDRTPSRAAGSAGGSVRAARLPPRVRRRAAGERRAVDRVLAYTSYVELAGRRRPEVALTFDDGPSRYTSAIVDILRRAHTPATFFVIGRWARQYPQLVATEARDGFEIGDHTETHPFLSALSPTAQAAQITQAATDIRAAGGPRPRLFRPPYGSFNQATLQTLRAQRLLMVLWSADTKDYARPGVAKIIYTAISGAQPGAIILMHDGGGDRSQTAASLPRIILRLRQRGFRLVTVAQLVADDPPSSRQPSPRPLSGRG